MRWLLPLLLLTTEAQAFAYLEHAWATDRACLQAQRVLATELPGADQATVARYLALALACPARPTPRYCVDELKQPVGHLNLLPGSPAETEELSVTLGDFAALPDHYSRYGPVLGLRRAGDGLLGEILELFGEEPDGPGGIIYDVAEDSCEHDDVPWDRIEEDTAAELLRGVRSVAPQAHVTMDRAPPPAGPTDPHALYSFDNPHYLDIIRFNHHHFRVEAYATWLGFHAAAVDLHGKRCEDVLGLDADQLEDIAEPEPDFDAMDWHDFGPAQMRAEGCRLLRRRLVARIRAWERTADPALVTPLKGHLPLDEAGLDAVLVGVMSVVLEGVGLHFLQDDLAGGHLRTDRSVGGLGHTRFVHDLDSDLGVSAALTTAKGEVDFVAYGDGRILGPAWPLPPDCAELSAASKAQRTACVLRHQRGLLVSTSAASLVDWGLGGPSYQGGNCEAEGARAYLCATLPMAPTRAGQQGNPAPRTLPRAELPVPPPPFSYESLRVASAIDATGGAPRLGARLVMLTELGAWAGWMRSYNIGLFTRPDDDPRYDVEFAHMFHFRWAARFLVNAGPFVYAGATGLGNKPDFVGGLGPDFGLSFLPEGWTTAPLEVTLTWRMPVRLLGGVALEAQFVEIALGLAFQ